MKRKALLILTLGAILFLAHPAHAQLIGDRLRIKTEDGEKFTGQLKGYNADSLILLTNSTEQSIAYADIARLQKSLGIRSQYEQGALIGFSAGMVSGLSALDTKLALGLVGGLTGAIVGARIRRERWKRLDISDPSAAFVMPGIGIHPPGLSALEKRMRITTENGEKLIGRQKGYDAYFLTILTDSTEISIAYADMARLQRSLGVRSHFIKGTAIGFGTGTVAGFFAASRIECNNEACVGAALAMIGSRLLGTVGGTLVGALVGASIRTERWERVDIPGQSAAAGMSITPTIGVHPGGGLALGARISF